MSLFSPRRTPAVRARPAPMRRWLASLLILSVASCDGGTGPTPDPGPQNPVPSVGTVTPAALLQWSDSTTITVSGSGFASGAVVRLNGTALPTTYVGASQLTAVAAAASMQQAATLQLTVFNPGPGGGESPAMPLPVHHRAPSVAQVSPATAFQGDTAFTLAVSGAGFSQGSVVRWNGQDRATTFVSQGQVTARIPATDVQQAAPASVTVYTPAPGGGESGAMALPVVHRAPVVAQVSPGVVLQGSGPFALTVTGSGFSQASVVRWNGKDRLTQLTAAGQLTAHVFAEDVQAAGPAAVTVFTPQPGGGTSQAVTLPVNNRAPGLMQLSPALVMRGSGAFTLNVFGTGFTHGSVVRWNGQDRPTTFLGQGQLSARIQDADVQAADTARISVFTPAPGGGESGVVPLPVHNPVPSLAMLDPASVMQGHGAFTITLYGTGFAPGSVVRWNGEPRPTTFHGAGQLSAQITAEDVQAVDTAAVTVFTPLPGGGTSSAIPFVVAVRPNPTPALAVLSPGVMVAETPTTFTLNGFGFMEGSQVTVGGYHPEATLVSPTQLRFALDSVNVPNAGFAQVFVTNPSPGGGTSNPLSLRVDNPRPVLSALSPAAAPMGLDSQVVRLTGTGFVRGSVVTVNGGPRAARRISATELEVVLRAPELSQTANLALVVVNDAPGGGASAARTFQVQNRVPVAQSVSPAQAPAGLDSLVVRVTGIGFVAGSVVRFGASVRRTTYVSPTELDAVLTAADLALAGTFSLTVVNPVPGGGLSQPVSLTVAAPVPVLTTLPSYGASAGRAGFPLTVHGTGFMPNSEVWWNGQPRATSYISGTRLEATVSSADLASAGAAAVSVHNPGGGTSAARQMTVRGVGAAAVTSTRTLALPARAIVYDPVSDRLYASMPSTAGERANTVVAINPATGEITGSLVVGSNPGELALSDDGSTLWVALDGAGTVRRVSLPGLTAGMQFSLNGSIVEEMHVMPGRPGTVAISLRNTCCSPRHQGVAIWDDGVRRANVTSGHTGSNSISFDETGSLLYGYNNESTDFGFRTMAVTAGGVTVTHSTGALISGFYQRIQYAAGRAYSGNGTVVDAGRRARAGAFGAGGTSFTVDAELGRIFYVNTGSGALTVYDLNTFQQLGTTTLGALYNEHPALAREHLVRWGTNGLALNDGQKIVIVRTAIAGP